jgi:hypothetical protein
MKKNMGSIDRGIRFFLAVLVALLYFTDQISGAAAIVFGIFAVVFFFTGFIGFCPLYSPFKFMTVKKAG